MQTSLVQVIDNPKIVKVIEPQRDVLVQIQEKRRQLDGAIKRKEFFGFENISGKVGAIKLALRKEEVRQQMAGAGYPREIDYSFLSWVNAKSKLPLFAVFPLGGNTMEIDFGRTPGGPYNWFCETIPKAIQRVYGQIKGMRQRIISCEIDVVMPESARADVVRAKKARLFDDMFIIAEAPKWNTVIRKDPLVVGWIRETEQMFLVTQFYPTDLETMVLGEFAA